MEDSEQGRMALLIKSGNLPTWTDRTHSAGTCPRHLLGTGKAESCLACLMEGDSALDGRGVPVAPNVGYVLEFWGDISRKRVMEWGKKELI